MNSPDDLDNLMDNFDMHAFWDKGELVKIVVLYGVGFLILGGFMTRSIIKAAVPGATPKGMTFPESTTKIIR